MCFFLLFCQVLLQRQYAPDEAENFKSAFLVVSLLYVRDLERRFRPKHETMWNFF